MGLVGRSSTANCVGQAAIPLFALLILIDLENPIVAVAKRAVRGVDGSPIRASPRISPFAMGCQWFAEINLGHCCWCQDLTKSGTSHLCQIVPIRGRHKNAAPVAVAHIRRKAPRIAAASHHHGTPRIIWVTSAGSENAFAPKD